MQQPYGPGLEIAPEKAARKVSWQIDRIARRVRRRLLRLFGSFGLDRFAVVHLIWVKDRIGREVSNYQRLYEPRAVDLNKTADPEFVQSCENYSSGELPLGEVFVCEVAPARYYPALGLVANRNYEVFGDSVLLPHRFELSPAYCSVRPLRTVLHAGLASTIQRIDAYSFWHWFTDCLPQLLTLERYLDGRPLTLFISDDLGGFQRETLKLALPPTMQVVEVPPDRWLRVERFLLPSYLSGRCNGYLPEGFYPELNRRITRGLGLPERARPELRLYLSRANARRRRIANEPALMELLGQYGFIAVRPETMTLREQVALFQRAEVIAGPHGGALGGMVFAHNAKVLVFYPQSHPGEYFLTMAMSLGLEHFAITHDCYTHEDSSADFPVDLARVQAKLEGAMGLTPVDGRRSPA